MEIIKLGRIERELLAAIRSGSSVGGLNAHKRRALGSLCRKGLIESDGEQWNATQKANEMASTPQEYNRIRNNRRTAAKVGASQGVNATYLYQTRKVGRGYGGSKLVGLIAGGTLKLREALRIRERLDTVAALGIAQGCDYEAICTELDKLLDELVEDLPRKP